MDKFRDFFFFVSAYQLRSFDFPDFSTNVEQFHNFRPIPPERNGTNSKYITHAMHRKNMKRKTTKFLFISYYYEISISHSFDRFFCFFCAFILSIGFWLMNLRAKCVQITLFFGFFPHQLLLTTLSTNSVEELYRKYFAFKRTDHTQSVFISKKQL